METPYETKIIHILRGYNQISRHMKKTPASIKKWVQEGAPIFFEEDAPSVPVTEANELWRWRKARGKSKTQ